MSRIRRPIRMKPLAQVMLATLCSAATQISHAQTANDLGSVQSTATSATANAVTPKQASAPYQAPTQASLSATEPQSTISRHYIENNDAPTANYSDIVQIAPSVSDIDPNGPGLMESQSLTIRGFKDGQYNVTFDGVPWGDSNDFTHHSTSYFMPQTVGSVTVDRGPGDAATIGPATFGGTISIRSIDPTMTPAFTPSVSYGSYNTSVVGAQFNTGDLAQLGDARAVVGYNQVHSDGYLTNASQRRQNAYFKLDKPLGDNTVVTLFATYNRIHQNVPLGATAAQIAQFGPNYGLSSNPASQAFFGYNFDDINTDFEYLGVQTKIGTWKISNKLYTYGYYHEGHYGADVNGETPNGTPFGPNDVPGVLMHNNYRAVGDIVRAETGLGPGLLQFGAWINHQTNFRDNYNVDETLGGAIYATNLNMNDTMLTFEPYVQYAWKVAPGLTITPGAKYVSFNRGLDAAVNQGSETPVNFSHTWTKVLPTLTVHEQINHNWSAYAQYAKGFLAPNLNVFYVPNPSISGQPDPEQTDNYQIGTAYKTDKLTVSGDLYYINFKNLVESRTVGANTLFFNAGGATYKGIEMEATYYAGLGFSLYGNLTFNDAKDKATGDWVPNAPNKTAAFGVIYQRGPAYGSLITKFVGHQFGDTGAQQPIGGFAVTNFAAAYTFKNLTPWTRDTKLGFQIDNIFNRRSIDALAGYTVADSTPLYWTIPGRAFFVTLSSDF